MIPALAALAGYVLGSIPNGFLFGKALGIDLRAHGSGNIGATNAFRILGKKWGVLVFTLDFAKGLAAVWLATLLKGSAAVSVLPEICAGIAAILGHNFPIWLWFKGGKGIATSAGVLVGLLPMATAVLIPVWALVFLITRYVSIASMAAAAALPVLVFLFLKTERRDDPLLFWFAISVALLAIWRHRINIQRLMNGTEHRFEKLRKG